MFARKWLQIKILEIYAFRVKLKRQDFIENEQINPKFVDFHIPHLWLILKFQTNFKHYCYQCISLQHIMFLFSLMTDVYGIM